MDEAKKTAYDGLLGKHGYLKRQYDCDAAERTDKELDFVLNRNKNLMLEVNDFLRNKQSEQNHIPSMALPRMVNEQNEYYLNDSIVDPPGSGSRSRSHSRSRSPRNEKQRAAMADKGMPLVSPSSESVP